MILLIYFYNICRFFCSRGEQGIWTPCICSSLRDFDHHANRFVEHYIKRKYPRRHLENVKKEVASMNRDDLLRYKIKPSSTGDTTGNYIPSQVLGNQPSTGKGVSTNREEVSLSESTNGQPTNNRILQSKEHFKDKLASRLDSFHP